MNDGQDVTTDWWSVNAPPAAASGGAVTPDQVAQLYQELLGRAPENADVVNGWVTNANTPTIDAVRAAIAASPEAQAYAKTKPAASSAPSGNYTDQQILDQVGKWAAMPGADPSLANDPNYWLKAIKDKGGLTPSNLQFWQDAGVGPTAFFNNPNREQGGAPSGTLPGAPANFGAAPATYTPMTWQGGAPPTAPTLATYTAPTAAQLEASPGYQTRLDAQDRAINTSAAAKGSVLNGGTQRALARYGQDYASNEYGNLVNQTQSGIALNNNATQTSFGDAFSNYQARYGQFTDAANRDAAAFTTNVANKRNTDTDYWSRLNDLYQTGAGLANNSYKPA